jgi:hypothetical protein
MKRKLSGILALATVLALSSTALAQDTTTLITEWTSCITPYLGQVAAIIWFILFASWGGFRYFY